MKVTKAFYNEAVQRFKMILPDMQESKYLFCFETLNLPPQQIELYSERDTDSWERLNARVISPDRKWMFVAYKDKNSGKDVYRCYRIASMINMEWQMENSDKKEKFRVCALENFVRSCLNEEGLYYKQFQA